MNITAVIVTRGDVDLNPILPTLDNFDEVRIWDNSKRTNRKVFGRYEAAMEARNDVIYVQDDDVVVNTPDIVCGHFDPGLVVANVPPERRAFYSDGVTLIGWGSVFHRRLLTVFTRYLTRWPEDELFLRECDRVFTGLNSCLTIDVPFTHLPHAHGKERMGMEPRHLIDLAEIRTRVAYLKSHD